MMPVIVHGKSIDSLWRKTFVAIKENGTKMSGIQEIPNLVLVLTDKFKASPYFDKHFRKIFGDERIDYAASVTFVPPKKTKLGEWQYAQNDPSAKWTNSYWGRMIAFGGNVNQIESAIKKLANGKNTKMISISIYDPTSDHRKVMGGVPCMTSVDVKPRNGKIDLTVTLRSMRFTKSGYGDVRALCDLGLYLAQRANMELGSVTMLATSGHIFYSGDEFQNSMKLLEALNKRKEK